MFLSLLAIGIGLVGVQMHLQLESVQVSVFGSKFPAVVAVLMASGASVVVAVGASGASATVVVLFAVSGAFAVVGMPVVVGGCMEAYN